MQRLFVDSLQPVEHGLLPLLPVFEILADAPAVAACRVDVHRGLDAVVLQCVVVERAVYGRDDAVVVRKQQQGGRGFAAHAVLERVPCVGLRVALVAQQGVERPLVRLAFFGRDDRVEEDREGGFGAASVEAEAAR